MEEKDIELSRKFDYEQTEKKVERANEHAFEMFQKLREIFIDKIESEGYSVKNIETIFEDMEHKYFRNGGYFSDFHDLNQEVKQGILDIEDDVNRTLKSDSYSDKEEEKQDKLLIDEVNKSFNELKGIIVQTQKSTIDLDKERKDMVDKLEEIFGLVIEANLSKNIDSINRGQNSIKDVRELIEDLTQPAKSFLKDFFNLSQQMNDEIPHELHDAVKILSYETIRTLEEPIENREAIDELPDPFKNDESKKVDEVVEDMPREDRKVKELDGYNVKMVELFGEVFPMYEKIEEVKQVSQEAQEVLESADEVYREISAKVDEKEKEQLPDIFDLAMEYANNPQLNDEELEKTNEKVEEIPQEKVEDFKDLDESEEFYDSVFDMQEETVNDEIDFLNDDVLDDIPFIQNKKEEKAEEQPSRKQEEKAQEKTEEQQNIDLEEKVEEKSNEQQNINQEEKKEDEKKNTKKIDSRAYIERTKIHNKSKQTDAYVNQIINNVKKFPAQLVDISRMSQEICQKLGISPKTSDFQTIQSCNQIFDDGHELSNGLKNIDVPLDASINEILEKQYSVENVKEGSSETLNHSENLKNLIPNIAQELENNIKKSLYEKVQKTIQKAKIEKYRQEKEKISGEKVSFVNRLLGGQAVKDAKLKNIDMKIQLVSEQKIPVLEKYSVHDMLSDIMVCSKTELDGKTTSEMKELYEAIRATFSSVKEGKISNETIQRLADKKIEQNQQNLPVLTQTKSRGFFGKKREELKEINRQNDQLNGKITEQRLSNSTSAFDVGKQSPIRISMMSELDIIKSDIGKFKKDVERINNKEDNQFQNDKNDMEKDI